MIRYFLAKGDKAGAAVIAEGLSTMTCANPLPRVEIATLYMKTYCSACRQTGFIAPQGPRRPNTAHNGKPIALSGDINICGCNPAPIFHAQRSMHVQFTQAEIEQLSATRYVPGHSEATNSMKKQAGDGEHSTDDSELICPNMSNAEFRAHILRLRDEATVLVEARLQQLERWHPQDQHWFQTWFGLPAPASRVLINRGLVQMRSVLKDLLPENFVRYSYETMRHVGCESNPHSKGTVAEVCSPDTATHTIAIRKSFCAMRPRHPRFDSQLLTLVHEISHFADVFNSRDHEYSTFHAKELANANDARAIQNADNIAGYIVCSE